MGLDSDTDSHSWRKMCETASFKFPRDTAADVGQDVRGAIDDRGDKIYVAGRRDGAAREEGIRDCVRDIIRVGSSWEGVCEGRILQTRERDCLEGDKVFG